MEILQTIVALFFQYGYFVVLAGVMLENAGIPLPGETVLLAAGFFASEGHFSLLAVMALGAVGAMLGDNIGYFVGKRAGRPLLDRYGRYLFVSPPRIASLEAFFAHHGPNAVLIGRFVSGFRVFIALFAGVSRMRWRVFLVYNAAGAVLWASAITSLGYFFGQSWALLDRWMGRVAMIAIGTVAVGLLLFVSFHRWKASHLQR